VGKLVLASLLVSGPTALFSAAAQSPLPLDHPDYVFKATHNSYVLCYGASDCPIMHDPLASQLDDYGVWAVELDGGLEPGDPTIYVGHDRPGSGLPGGGNVHTALIAYLEEIKASEAFQYRPVLVFFECKCDAEGWNCNCPDVLDKLESTLVDTVGYAGLFTPADYAEHGWLTVPELARRLIVWTKGIPGGRESAIVFTPEVGDTPHYPVLPNLRRNWHDDCVNQEVLDDDRAHGDQILSLDQYEEEFTWTYSVPPNPIHVGGTQAWSLVSNPDLCGASANCPACYGYNTSPGVPHLVFHHGTQRFPYPTLTMATDALAAGKGFGWTIKLAPGSYPGSFTFSSPMRLETEGPGSVLIGQ